MKKKFPKEEDRGHVNYCVIILVYLVLHSVLPSVMHARDYLFRSYLDPPRPPPQAPCLRFDTYVTAWSECSLNVDHAPFVLL